MEKVNPFIYIESISSSKHHIMKGTENDILAEKGYLPFLTNRNLSYFPDTLGDANVMNRLGQLDNRMQYDYYFHTLRPRRRFSGKWGKAVKTTDLDAICERFNCSYRKAMDILPILSPAEFQRIHAALEKGGK